MRGIGIADALDFLPGFVITPAAKQGLMNGVLPGYNDVLETVGAPEVGNTIRLLDEMGELLAVGTRGEGAARDRLKCVDSYRLFADNGRP